MVKHIIIWNLKDSLSEEERTDIKRQIQKEIEALNGKIDGLIEAKVVTDIIESSNADWLLECTFKDRKALEAYAVNPLHVAVKDSLIMPNIISRVCIDYEQ